MAAEFDRLESKNARCTPEKGTGQSALEDPILIAYEI